MQLQFRPPWVEQVRHWASTCVMEYYVLVHVRPTPIVITRLKTSNARYTTTATDYYNTRHYSCIVYPALHRCPLYLYIVYRATVTFTMYLSILLVHVNEVGRCCDNIMYYVVLLCRAREVCLTMMQNNNLNLFAARQPGHRPGVPGYTTRTQSLARAAAAVGSPR